MYTQIGAAFKMNQKKREGCEFTLYLFKDVYHDN